MQHISKRKTDTGLLERISAARHTRFIIDRSKLTLSRQTKCGKKHYRYIIDTNTVQDVFTRQYRTHFPESLSIKDIKAAASLLLGEHDFKSFCDNKHMKKSTIRRIDSIHIKMEAGILTIDFLGNGFLYHMIRILVGTLLEIGQKKRKPEDITAILQAKDRTAAGFTAQPQGLYLVKVFY